MAKALKPILAGLAVASLVGAGGFWYVASGRVVEQVAAQVQAFNTRTRPDGDSAKISYDRLQRTMFPAIGARIVNPALELNQQGDGASTPPMILSWKGQGTTDLIINHITHSYRVDTNGSSHIDLQAGEEKIAAESQPNATHLTVAAKDAAAFKAWGTLDTQDANAVRAALRDIKKFSFDFGPVLVKDATSGSTILSQEKSMVRLANRSTDTQADFDLKAEVRGTQVTKEYNDIVNRVIRAGRVPVQMMDDEAVPFSMARAGLQDLIIDLSVDAPLASGPMSDGHIEVRAFSVKNNFYRAALPGKVVLSEKDGGRNAALKLDWTLEVTPAGAAEMARMVAMGSGRIPVLSSMAEKAGANASPEEVKQKILAALPTLSTLGPITLAVDLDARVPAPPPSGQIADANAPERVTVNGIALNHTRWGFEAKGKLERKRQDGTTVDMTLDCKRCDILTGDLYASATNAQDLMNLLQPGREQWRLSDAMLTNLNQLLADAGRKDANGDITFTIASPKPNDIRLNDKPVGEFMAQLMVTLNPPQAADEAPAAGGVAE